MEKDNLYELIILLFEDNWKYSNVTVETYHFKKLGDVYEKLIEYINELIDQLNDESIYMKFDKTIFIRQAKYFKQNREDLPYPLIIKNEFDYSIEPHKTSFEQIWKTFEKGEYVPLIWKYEIKKINLE